MGFDINPGQFVNNVVAPAAGMIFPPAGAFLGQGAANQANWDLTQAANQANQASADKSMAFSADQAKINRDFQENMSNTAHQREVADLQKAGLNPLMAANAGASTPSGAMGSGAQASNAVAPYGSPTLRAIDTGIETAKVVSNVVGTLSQMQVNSAQQAALRSSAILTQAQAAKVSGVDTDLAAAQTQKAITDTQVQQGEIPVAQSKYSAWQALQQFLGSTAKQWKDDQNEIKRRTAPHGGTRY